MGLPRPEDDRYFSLGTPSDPVFAVFAEKRGGAEGRKGRMVLRDPAQLDTDWGAVQLRKKNVGETMECPHCQEALSKWEVPDDPCIDWPNDYLYLCFNDFCPFVVRGWRFMWNQGILGTSYRYLFNPLKGTSTTVPIRGLTDLRPGIVDEDPAGRFRSAIEPRFGGLLVLAQGEGVWSEAGAAKRVSGSGDMKGPRCQSRSDHGFAWFFSSWPILVFGRIFFVSEPSVISRVLVQRVGVFRLGFLDPVRVHPDAYPFRRTT